MPSGANSRPSMPESANSGTNTRMMIGGGVDDARPHLLGGAGDDRQHRQRVAPCALFSRRRRKTFSTSTTASSTSSPMAMARPPSVIVLMVRPNSWKTITVIRMEIGMAVSEIAVVRQFSRNRNRTHGDDDERLDQHAQHVVDRHLDERGLAEQHVDGGDVLRQNALQIGEGRLDLGRSA